MIHERFIAIPPNLFCNLSSEPSLPARHGYERPFPPSSININLLPEVPLCLTLEPAQMFPPRPRLPLSTRARATSSGAIHGAREQCGAIFTDLRHASPRKLPRHSHELAFFALVLKGHYGERCGRAEAPLGLAPYVEMSNGQRLRSSSRLLALGAAIAAAIGWLWMYPS